MPGTRYPNAEGHPPSPPSKGGRAKRKGGMLSLQRGGLGGCSYQRPEGVSPHKAQGLKARYILAPSRKGGVSMPAPCLKG